MAGAANPRPGGAPEPPTLPAYPRPGEEQTAAMLAVGEYLYGRYGWQSALARRLCVDPRSVRRWISGQDPVGPTAWELIKMLVRWKAAHGAPPDVQDGVPGA